LEEYVPEQALPLSFEVIMRAKLKAKILDITKNIECKDGNTNHAGMTRMRVSSRGKIETTLNNAQAVFLQGEIFLREVIADQMKVGATITITLSDEEPAE
jgi:hypothetical protein